MNKVDKVKLFKEYINKYIDFYSLYEWEIFIYEQEKLDARASCRYGNIQDAWGQIASIFYSKHWIEKKELTECEIKIVAFHEVTELFLSHLVLMAHNKEVNISNREVKTESHRIIRILENKLFPLIKEKDSKNG